MVYKNISPNSRVREANQGNKRLLNQEQLRCYQRYFGTSSNFDQISSL
ncbi:hypothetical protein LLB_1106 [Legionella longbeachae D-4968]|nr:hypothetical protein LLB_1106 [Legionella longbeachae D-4968]